MPETNSKALVFGLIGAVILAIGIASLDARNEPSRSSLSKDLRLGAQEAGEYVEYYGAQIEVLDDGAVVVDAMLRVVPAHFSILYGVSFNVPIRAVGASHGIERSYEVFRSSRDGSAMDVVHLRESPYASRLYLGDMQMKETLTKTIHVFDVGYRIVDLLEERDGFLEIADSDMFGMHWKIPTKSAVISLKLPKRVRLASIQASGYVGTPEERRQIVQTKIDHQNHSIVFWPTKELDPLEGFFISARWPASE